jgi:hypothetical protein
MLRRRGRIRHCDVVGIVGSVARVRRPDYDQAIAPVERRKFLLHYEERSAHYEILCIR